MNAHFDYATAYDDYWQREDRRGSASFSSAPALARQITALMGLGPALDVGCGMGHLVQSLCDLGVNAQGVDVSREATRLANARVPGHFVTGSILELPFPDRNFPTVICTDCLEHLAPQDVPRALAELCRVSSGGVYLEISLRADRDRIWHLTVATAGWWEQQLFEAGFRRHPRWFSLQEYADDSPAGSLTWIGEKIPCSANTKHPLALLQKERDLHMDMSREGGRRSDAHMVRYELAARLIRPGQIVLDAACGLGYGCNILAANSDAAAVTGIDDSESAIDYCRDNFGADQRLRFLRGSLPDALLDIEPGSIDFIASFETLEHLHHPEQFLAACHRVLAPGGRLMVSVPNDWADDTGSDPNPHHFHVYDWQSLRSQLTRAFVLDRGWLQNASRSKKSGKFVAVNKSLRAFALSGPGEIERPESEWLLLVAAKSPLDTRGEPFHYAEVAWPEGRPQPLAVDFGHAYANPWIASSLVNHAARPRDQAALHSILGEIEASGPSTDRGAALCIRGYRLLENRDADTDPSLELAIGDWFDKAGNTAHETRWRISLTFLLGRLAQHAGRRDDAIRHYSACASIDDSSFAVSIRSKRIEACHRMGFLLIGNGDAEGARQAWRRSIELAQDARSRDLALEFGPPDDWRPFVMQEFAALFSIAARSSKALSTLNYQGALAARHLESIDPEWSPRSALAPRPVPTGPASPAVDQDVARLGKPALLRANPWCRIDFPSGRTYVLHPSGLEPGADPGLQFSPPGGISSLFLLATAQGVHPQNPGVALEVLFWDTDNEAPCSHERITVPPRASRPLYIAAPGGVIARRLELRAHAPEGASVILGAALRVEIVRCG